MVRRNWDTVARKEFEAMDADERESFMELRARVYDDVA